MESTNYTIKDYNTITNYCIDLFNKLNLGIIIYLELILEENKNIIIEIKNNLNKYYYFITNGIDDVVEVREGSLDGKKIFVQNNNELEVTPLIESNEEINDDYGDEEEIFMRKYKVDENGQEYEEIIKTKLDKCPSCNELLLIMGDNKSILSCPKCKTDYLSFGGKIYPYPINKMTTEDINSLINDIDKNIDELEVEKRKIDNKIENNFEEVSKYSILNKTIDELLSAKKKFVNDWDMLLFNIISDDWIMKSATYRIHIISIIYAILNRIDDNVSKQQLELLNDISKYAYFENQDKESIVKIVKQLKEMESK